ncbi:BamA/TamA family outer membrane protein [Vibrio maritimus]|uniref:BamA/TamA family outer membrane protein n=1 Tax=Vibrio maritimus TaxID=990268 RepID=UPI004068A7EB
MHTKLAHSLLAMGCSACLSVSAIADDHIEPLFEHTPNSTTDKLDSFLGVFGAESEYDKEKGLNSSYIPAVFYTPEQGLGLGLLYVGLYGDPSDGAGQPSSMVINPYASSNGSIGITFSNKHFYNGGDKRVYTDIKVFDDAAVYYGQGYENGQQDGNKINFKEQVVDIKPTWLTRVSGDYFLGFGGNIKSVRPHDKTFENQNSDYLADELTDNTSYGVFVSNVFDTRDNVTNATKGTLLQADLGLYHDATNSENFGKYSLKASQYHSLAPVPGLLAWQVQANLTSGNVPWNQLPDLGGADAMRGYVLGRYRDNQMMMGQVEYRLPVYWRVGVVFWGAAGTVSENVSGLWENTLASAGTGFRFKIKDKVNVRADIGYGEHGGTFYFHVNEVF